MSTVSERILEYLRKHPEGIDDDRLAVALGLTRRQHANAECRRLEDEGLITRHHFDGKIHNYIRNPGSRPHAPRIRVPDGLGFNAQRPWYWEGNVQSRIGEFLRVNRYEIVQISDTASKQRGKDIIAKRNGMTLWCSVKGFPEERPDKKTKPSVQARHWYSHAMFDMICWRNEDQHVDLAVGLPEFPRYRSLHEKTAWFRGISAVSFFWVGEDGEVKMEVG